MEKARIPSAVAAPAPARPLFDRAFYESLAEQPRGVGLPDDEALDPDGGFWVFAYGSLLWRPGFSFDRRVEAILEGHERAFCLWSVRYRGTPDAPGLVLGVRPKADATVWGAAYHVTAAHAAEARAYLHERELVTASYLESKAMVVAQDETQERIEALTYVVDCQHPQYAGEMSLQRQAEIIAIAEGAQGPNCDYLFSTAEHLRELGGESADLEDLYALERMVRARKALA